MKARYFVGFIAAAVLVFVAFFSALKPEPQAPAGNPYATNGSLAGAYEMAEFIDQIRDSIPNLEPPARDHLNGVKIVFFVSDYVMAAKTNKNLALTRSAIICAFTNVSSGLRDITNRLQFWAERSGNLSDHYHAILNIPTEKTNMAAIQAIMRENGVPIDTKSDLLMDCIRYVVQITQFHEMYGPNPKSGIPTPSPQAFNALISTSEPVFRHRFETKFGLKPQTVTKLMDALKQVRLYDLGPPDVEIPAHLR